MMYVHTLDRQRPRRLPRSWDNVSGLDRADAATLRALGWYPFEDAAEPAYNEFTHKAESRIVIDGEKARRVWTISPRDENDTDRRFNRYKADAKRKALRMIDEAADALLAGYSRAEIQSWPQKEEAARAFRAGSPSDLHLAMLRAEAQERGVTVPALSQLIIQHADAFREKAAKLAGYRAKTAQRIESASRKDVVDTAVERLGRLLADL